MSFIILFILVTFIILFLPRFLGGQSGIDDEQRFNTERLSQKDKELIVRYSGVSAKGIVLNENIDYFHKLLLLQKVHSFSYEEAREFCNAVIIEEKKAKLKAG